MRVSAIAGSVLTLVAVMAPSAGSAADFAVEPGAEDVIDARGQESSGRPSGAVGRPVTRGAFDPDDPRNDPANYILDVQVRLDATRAAPCIRVSQRFVLGGANSRRALDAEARLLRSLRNSPLCPRPTPAPARLSPGAVALTLWRERVQLPPPAPRIAPGWGIVGKDAYLEIGGAREPGPWRFDALGYTITITARSRYEVDWGDGSRALGLTSQGGPWPTGEITHPYQVDGAYRVTVRQRWTATWSATNGEQGVIDEGLQTVGTLDFPVRELQAVRDR
jgi:hypothetical protein